MTNPKVSSVLPNTGALSHHGRSSLCAEQILRAKKKSRSLWKLVIIVPSPQTVVPLWWHRKGCARNSGRVASPGLWQPAGSGGELVEVGGSERKDKATCVAASEGKKRCCTLPRLHRCLRKERKKWERMNRRGCLGRVCVCVCGGGGVIKSFLKCFFFSHALPLP